MNPVAKARPFARPRALVRTASVETTAIGLNPATSPKSSIRHDVSSTGPSPFGQWWKLVAVSRSWTGADCFCSRGS